MSCGDTFHHFSRLPTELRLQIWKAACLPFDNRGLHYVTFDEVKRLNLGRRQWAKHQCFIGRNRSTDFWDGGLWRACKESREVIMRHAKMHEWVKIRSRAEAEHKTMKAYDPSRVPEQVRCTITIQQDHEEWHFMIYPTRDVFCITSDNWESLVDSWQGMSLTIPFIGYSPDHNFHWENVALEFDPSWNATLPYGIWELCWEKSARGVLAGMLLDIAQQRWPQPKIWLIDNSAHWVAKPSRHSSPVFHDCDGESVEIGWHETYCDTAEGVRGSPVNDFIQELGWMADDDLQDFILQHWSPSLIEYFGQFSVENSIGLFVRRNNQVLPS